MRKKELLAIVCLLLGFLLAGCSRTYTPEAYPAASKDSLGMLLLNLSDEEAIDSFHVSEPGVFVLILDESADAYRAGLRSGDRIVSCNGITVKDAGELDQLYEAEGTYSLEVYRTSDETQFFVMLDNRKAFDEGDTSK